MKRPWWFFTTTVHLLGGGTTATERSRVTHSPITHPRSLIRWVGPPAYPEIAFRAKRGETPETA